MLKDLQMFFHKFVVKSRAGMSPGMHAHPMHVLVSNRVDPPPHGRPLYEFLWLWSPRRRGTVAALCLPPPHRHPDLRGGSAAATVASHRDCDRLILLSNASPNSYLRMRPRELLPRGINSFADLDNTEFHSLPQLREKLRRKSDTRWFE